MANGRLERESNPIQGEKPGYYPQHETNTAGEFEITGKRNPLPTTDSIVLAKLQEMDDKIQGVIDGSSPANTQLTGSKLQEQKTEADASSGIVIFSSDILAIELYNRDSVDGVFTVNNIAITVPADESFQATVGGTPSNEVSISGSTSYIIGRYA